MLLYDNDTELLLRGLANLPTQKGEVGQKFQNGRLFRGSAPCRCWEAGRELTVRGKAVSASFFSALLGFVAWTTSGLLLPGSSSSLSRLTPLLGKNSFQWTSAYFMYGGTRYVVLHYTGRQAAHASPVSQPSMSQSDRCSRGLERTSECHSKLTALGLLAVRLPLRGGWVHSETSYARIIETPSKRDIDLPATCSPEWLCNNKDRAALAEEIL